MGSVKKPFLYGALFALTPHEFRARHRRSIDKQLEQGLRDDLAAGLSPRLFWLRAARELLRSLPGLWLASWRRWRRSAIPPHSQDSFMNGLLYDLRFGIRGLYSQPGASLLCVAAIALGIGANTTVFTLANEIFLRPVAVHEPSRLVDLHVDQPGTNSFAGFSYPEFEDLRETTAFEGIGAQSGVRMQLGPERGVTVTGQFTSANYLEVLGVDVAIGRGYAEREALPGAPLVVVVSHGFWQRRLGGSPSAVGATIQLDGHVVTVIGILKPGYNGRFIGFPSEIWLPLGASETMRPGSRIDDRANQMLELIGRLGDGATLESAHMAINAIATALEEQYPDTNQDRRVSLSRFTGLDESLRAGVMGFVGVLGALSALVLAAACLNVGNLLLARGQARATEIATRLALGAARLRIVRQLLTETLLLFVIGAVAAIALTLQLQGLLRRLIGASTIPLGLDFSVDARVLATTVLITLVTAVVTGLQPAWQAAASSHANILRGGRGGSAANRRMRRWFVGAQVTVSVVLLVMAGLFLRALDAGRSMDPGFPTDDLQLARLTLATEDYSAAEAALIFDRVAANLRVIPGVATAGLGSSPPVGVANTPAPITVPGMQPPEGQEAFFVDAHIIDSQYLAATGIPMLDGRTIAPGDDAGSADVAVVNQTMAQRLWPSRNGVGEQFMLRGREIRVVGVAGNTLHLVQDRQSGPLMYLPLSQHPRHTINLVMRSPLPSASLTQQIRAQLDDMAPAAQLTDARLQRELLDASLLPQEIASKFAGGLGGVGLILALTGIYGMVAFAAAARRREMGIRMALGAAPDTAVRLLLRSAMVLVGVGATVGILASAAIAPLLQSFLLGISPLDPITLLTVLAGMVIAAGTAAYFPARRIATIDPAATLRED